MNNRLKKRYILTTNKQDLSERITGFKQGSTEYSDEFHALSSKAEVDEPEYNTVGCYKRGLNKPTCDIMCLPSITTIVHAFHATNVESLLASNHT